MLIAALLSLGTLPRLAAQVTPLMVMLLPDGAVQSPAVHPAADKATPLAAAAQPLPEPRPRATPTAAAPVADGAEILAPVAAPAPTATAFAPAAPSTPAQTNASSNPALAPSVEAAAPPPPRRLLPASAVAYRVLPPVEVPRASRRAGESGTVWLRVRVDTQGAPALVALHRSSGFTRLDEQALWAMRQARFQPHTEDGRAVEVDVIAPIEYPAE